MKNFRVLAITAVPKAIVAQGHVEPGELPQQMTPVTRVAPCSAEIDGTTVSLDRYESDVLGPLAPQHDLVRLVADVKSDDWESALKVVEPALELVIESLSFQTQMSLAIHQLEIMDLTPPVEVGQTREMMLFPWPQGHPLPPFYVSEAMGDVHTDHFINLGLRDRATDRRTAAAKRWYMKALAVPYQVDRFMLMWIALEIMWKASDVSVEEHWKCDCGAVLETCPECSKPTTRQLRGASIRAFLERECSVESEDAKVLWRLRQVLHGDVDFDDALMRELPRLLQVLRASVVSRIKAAVGMAYGEPPLVVAGQVSVRPNFGLGGSREIFQEDLRPPPAL